MYTVGNEGQGAPGAPAEEGRGAHRASKGAEWKQVAARWARPGWMEGWVEEEKERTERERAENKVIFHNLSPDL